MSERPVDLFRRLFHETCSLTGVPTEQVEMASNAVGEIFNFCESHLAQAGTFDPYFAGHDLQHPIRLAGRFKELLRTTLRSGTSLSLDTIVLVFSSLLLHDIGMCVESESTSSIPIEEVWSGHKIRPQHDQRSREFIETKLLTKVSELPSWCAFWRVHGTTLRWPTPCERYALFLVARICQAHGDPEERWLSSEELNTYHPVTSSRVIDFPEVWGHRAGGNSWSLTKSSLESAAAMLSMLDLCDISKERFRELPESLLIRAFPNRPQFAQESFVHWLTHSVTTLDFSSQKINVEIAKSESFRFAQLLPLLMGPAADLIKWGNNLRLLELLRTAGLSLVGIESCAGPTDQVAWDRVDHEAERIFTSVSGRSGYHTLETNAALAPDLTKIDSAFLYPMWWKATAWEVGRDLSEVDKGAYSFLELLIRTRAVGLLLTPV